MQRLYFGMKKEQKLFAKIKSFALIYDWIYDLLGSWMIKILVIAGPFLSLIVYILVLANMFIYFMGLIIKILG